MFYKHGNLENMSLHFSKVEVYQHIIIDIWI